MLENRAFAALRRPANWIQLAQFGVVGASGYLVNLGVYTLLLKRAGVHYIAAATISFVIAASWNYWWNRHWTFKQHKGHLYYQGLRFLIVSLAALGANLLILRGLVAAGMDKIGAQALAIVLVTPLNFLGNRLWSFRSRK